MNKISMYVLMDKDEEIYHIWWPYHSDKEPLKEHKKFNKKNPNKKLVLDKFTYYYLGNWGCGHKVQKLVYKRLA